MRFLENDLLGDAAHPFNVLFQAFNRQDDPNARLYDVLSPPY